MQGRKRFLEKTRLSFKLSERVPPHNFYRRLKDLLDLDFLYGLTAPYYGKCGQKSIDPVVQFTSEVPEVAKAFREILDDNWNSLRVAYLATRNGTGLELFEFQSTKSQRASTQFESWKTGFFHIGITTPDIDTLAEAIVLAGGKQRTQPITFTQDGCRYSYRKTLSEM
jgi:hypothetical protein